MRRLYVANLFFGARRTRIPGVKKEATTTGSKRGANGKHPHDDDNVAHSSPDSRTHRLHDEFPAEFMSCAQTEAREQ